MFLIGSGQIFYLSAAFVLIGLIAVGRLRPRATPPWARKIGLLWRRFAKRRATVVILAGVTSFALCAIAAWVRFPQPRFHDEFAYLLASDTYAEGRLTNPTHPMWHFFESFQIIHVPSYIAKYPPGQGLFLALGQIIWHPILGVWISTALATVAICWMLQAWVPGRWALFGAVLVSLHTGVQLQWGTRYWGGAVALLGGALVLGALPRIERHLRVRDAIWMSLGASLLAISRPLEGMALCIAVGLRLAYTVIWRNRADLWKVARQFVLPSAAVLAVAFAWMGYYNWRGTGDPLTMPYGIYQATYPKPNIYAASGFGAERTYRHKELRRFYGSASKVPPAEASIFNRMRRPMRRLIVTEIKEFIGFPLVFLILLSFLSLKTQKTAFFCMMLIWCHAVQLWVFLKWPHYLAPAMPFVFAMAVQGARTGTALVRRNGIARVSFILGFIGLYLVWLGDAFVDYNTYKESGFRYKRPAVISQLSDQPGKHLIVCRYSDDHNLHSEYVYNRADIDRSKIVWAREMSPEQNKRLFKYFSDRRVWLYHPDRGGKLEEYPGARSARTDVGNPAMD